MRPFLVLVARTLSLIFLLTASSAVGADFPLYDDDPRIRSSVNYLLSCQNPDGGFGEIPGNSSALLVTADVAMALAQTSDINLAIRDGKTILDYLIDKRPPASNVSTGDLGRYLMGVVAAGGNPHDFAESGYVDILKYRSRQLTEIDPSEEAYALLGLIAVRELESIEARTYVRDLKSRQFDSGGWGKNSSLPDTDTTGLVLCALIGSGEDVNATWMKKALTWLGSVQKDDGGFSGCLSSPDGSCSPSTGLAVMAILAMGQRPVEEPWRIGDANPVNFLLSCQQPNGSIWLKPDAPGPLISGYTAFGLISLTGGWLPTARLAPPSPVISVHKTANVSLALPGDTILYTIRVNNTGNRTLSDVVADDNLTKHQEYIGFLDPGKNHTFTTEYTVKRVDIGKPIVNNVTARGTYDGVVYQGFDTESVDTVYNPNIAVNKTANVTEVDKAGSIILYTIWVNNTGNTILRDIVADDSLTKLKEDIGSLDPGKNHSFTTTYTVKAADLGKPIINKVTASGKDPEGKSHENSSTVTVETESPDIVLMQLMVFNDGALVFNKTVDVVGVNPTSWDAIQQSGASYEYTDWGGGLGIFIDRLAGVGEPGWGPSFWIDGKFSEWGASNWHIHEGEIDQWIGPNSDSYSAKILRVDDATPASVAKGESFRVKITEETVYWGIPAGTPSRGATVTVGFDKYITNSEGLTPEITLNRDAYYGIYAVKPKHLATYWLGHISPIDGISTIKCGAGGPLISDLTGEKPPTNPNIEVKKTANLTEASTGDVIGYTIWVNNTGDTSLSDVVARDDLTGKEMKWAALKAGEKKSFITEYTVKTADLGKPVVNRVTVRGKDPEGKSHENSSTVTVETESPDIVLMQLMVFNDGALVFNKTVDVVGVNPTSWDAIQQSGASYEYTDWGGGLGIFIDRLAGVGEPGWGPSFWIDGKFSEWGASNWHIHEGEIDQWIGPNSDSYSAKILRVDDATPASVAKGESFRVKITEETVYWGIPAGTPSRGATVTVGFDKYITNSEGLTPEITLNRDAYYGIYAVKPKHLATYWLGHISPIDGISTIKCGAGGPLISDLTGEKPPTNPNIEVKKTANLTEASTGDVIGYTIWVNNTGDTSLSDVVARDDLTGKEMKWAALKAGEKKSFITEYTVKTADLGKPVVNRVTVRGKDPEGKSHENSSTALVKTPSIPVTIHKSASPKGGLPLTEISFFIAVTNTGDDDLHAVSVVDHLPPGLVYASDNRSGLLSGNEITWEIGDLGRGESDFIELAAEIEEGAFGILTNEVNVAAIDETGKEVTHSSSEDVIALETETLDFGDAPESYSTLLAGNGARHVIIPNFCLGYIIDGEPEAWASSDALGDNIHDLNDEDGVSITDLLLIPGATSTIDVHASDDGGYLNAWIDFGADGSWAEGLDQIFVDRPLNKGSNSLTFFIPPEAKEDSETFARFRFSTEKGLSFAGLALDGEVEDYRLNIGKNPRVVVSKTADKTEVKRGDDINYTIRIDNTLGMPLHNVVVRDVFNKSVEFVSASPAPDSDGIWRFPEVGVGGMTINLTVKVPKVRDMAFNMDQEVTGVGFMNIANDYDTSLESYAIENCVYVTSDETGDMVFRDCESVAISGDPGTKLSTREHGSGSYQGEERLRVRTENRSISMDKNMSAAYSPTAFALYNNRTIDYSSKWMEGAWAKNWATGSSMSEYYRYATSIDRESRFDIDKNGTSMEFDTSFEGQGHMGTILTSGQHATPSVEFREDYSGSFNIYQRTDEYGSGTISEKTTQGTGFVSVDKRIKESQRSYEYGTGNYSSEEIIGSSSNYIAKNISVEHRPSSFKVGGEPYSNQSLKWNEGISSKTPDTSFIGEEYTGIDHMEKETVARGLNEMETEAEFSGQARYRTVLQDDIDLVALRGAIDIDQVYIGEYSLRRHILIEGVSRVDHPHLAVNKSGELYYGDESVLARYRITLENDGNQSLDSIYIEDFFPPHAVYINSTARPSELTASSANWTLTHLSIGDRAVIDLWLDVTNYAGDELVNRVAASGAYNETWVTAFNFTVLDVDWLAYNLQRTLAVSKSAELSQDQPDVVRYSLTIQNLKGSDRVLRITDPLPQGMEFLEASVPPSSDEHGVLTWNQIELGPFQTKTIFYDAKALWPGTFVTWAEVDVGAVNGTSVPTQYAMAIIDVGVSDGERSAEVWQPPDWGFNLTCYDCDLEATKPICGEKE